MSLYFPTLEIKYQGIVKHLRGITELIREAWERKRMDVVGCSFEDEHETSKGKEKHLRRQVIY